MILQYTGEPEEAIQKLSYFPPPVNTTEDWGSVAGAVDTVEDWGVAAAPVDTTENWGTI